MTLATAAYFKYLLCTHFYNVVYNMYHDDKLSENVCTVMFYSPFFFFGMTLGENIHYVTYFHRVK